MDAEEHRRKRREYMRRWYSIPANAIKQRERSQKWRREHTEEHRAYSHRWIAEHPDHRRRYDSSTRRQRIEQEYGADYQAMLASQGGVCAICRQPERVSRVKHFCIDHDHATGAIRGLLCVSCNISLGYFERGYKSKLNTADVNRYLKR